MCMVLYLILLVATAATSTLSGLLAELEGGVILFRVMLLVGGFQVLVVAAVAALAGLESLRRLRLKGTPVEMAAPGLCRWEPGALDGGPIGRRHRHR